MIDLQAEAGDTMPPTSWLLRVSRALTRMIRGGRLPTGAVESQRILRAPQVAQLIGLSRVTLWRRMRAGQFPPPRHLGANAIGWPAAEVHAWIAARPARAAVSHLRSARGAPPPGRGRSQSPPDGTTAAPCPTTPIAPPPPQPQGLPAMARIDEAGTITVRIFGTGRAAVIAPTPQKGRTGCGRCHRWASPGALGGSLLGIEAAYCGACLSELIEACEGRHGRRPLREQEFYCPRCQAIHPLSLLTPSDPNGRRRLICRLCRAEDVAAAGERRAERLKDHDQRSDGDETNETGGDDA